MGDMEPPTRWAGDTRLVVLLLLLIHISDPRVVLSYRLCRYGGSGILVLKEGRLYATTGSLGRINPLRVDRTTSMGLESTC